jgi:hypothetical protein
MIMGKKNRHNIATFFSQDFFVFPRTTVYVITYSGRNALLTPPVIKVRRHIPATHRPVSGGITHCGQVAQGAAKPPLRARPKIPSGTKIAMKKNPSAAVRVHCSHGSSPLVQKFGAARDATTNQAELNPSPQSPQ